MVGRRLLNGFVGGRRRAELLRSPTVRDDVKAIVQSRQVGENDHLGNRLYEAAANGAVKAVDALIQAGAPVDWQTAYGHTPLYMVSIRGHAEVVDMLLRAGADVNLITKLCRCGDSAPHSCCGGIHGMDVQSGYTPLMEASSKGHADVVAMLLRAGADVNLADKYGNTPLIEASGYGYAAVVNLLLRAGTDIHMLNTDGWSAVHMACCQHRHGVLRLLLSRSDALLDTADNRGYLPLHLALLVVWIRGCSDDALKTLQLLVAHGSAWDETCENIAHKDIKWASSMIIVPDSQSDNNQWRRESPAIRLCYERWMLDHKRHRPLTDVPIEEVRRGVDATKTYLAEIAGSDNVTVRCKICVVGPSTWGKTSLIKSLTRKKPSLVHIDNRTIGIDHFKLKFDRRDEVLQAIKQHEVTFWDFAGQDAYQVAHSLFFSARTLYVVCVDLESFVLACMQAQFMTDTESEFDHWLNDFIETKVLKWVRVICARQPDAEFVYVATKKDRVEAADLEDSSGALAILRALLEKVEAIVHEMKKALKAGNESSLKAAAAALPISYLGDPRLAALAKKPSVRMIVTSCVTTKDVNAFKLQIQDAIVESDRGYAMPDKYSRVLEELLAMRATAAALGTDARLHNTFVTVTDLVNTIMKKMDDDQDRSDTPVKQSSGTSETIKPYLDESTCRTILRTLRDLGDILWYDTIDDEMLQNKIVLDPMLMIDLVRQVFNHKRTAETMTHYTLKELHLWKYLEGTDGMLSMKRVLHHFQLVYPVTSEMQVDSDLIVPAYWQSNTCAFWMFGGGDLRFGKGIHREDVAVRVHWEFQFVNNYPGTLFDNLVVASCSASYKRDVGPDWIMYMEKDKCACRLVLKRALSSHHWILHLEALQSHTANDDEKEHLWDCFMLLSTSLETVIRGYPGVVVARYARQDTQEDVEETRNTLDSLRRSPKLSVPSRKWMPPQTTWEAYLAHTKS